MGFMRAIAAVVVSTCLVGVTAHAADVPNSYADVVDRATFDEVRQKMEGAKAGVKVQVHAVSTSAMMAVQSMNWSCGCTVATGCGARPAHAATRAHTAPIKSKRREKSTRLKVRVTF